MARDKSPIPTKAELEILQVLWQEGPLTVKAVHERMGRASGYTTVLKMLQIMTEKGLVSRKAEGKAHIYRALASEKKATGEFIKELVERVFMGSPARLVMQALDSGKTSRKEIAEIRQMIERIEKEGK